MRAESIGMLETEDEAGNDNKIIAVPMPKVDNKFKDYNDVSDIPQKKQKMISSIFLKITRNPEPGK